MSTAGTLRFIATTAILDDPAPLTDPRRLDTRGPNGAVDLAGHPAVVLPVRVRVGCRRRSG